MRAPVYALCSACGVRFDIVRITSRYCSAKCRERSPARWRMVRPLCEQMGIRPYQLPKEISDSIDQIVSAKLLIRELDQERERRRGVSK